MSSSDDPEPFSDLMPRGVVLREQAIECVQSWPVGPEGAVLSANLRSQHAARVEELAAAIRRWFNEVNLRVLPLTLYDRRYLYVAMQHVEAGLIKTAFVEEHSEQAEFGFWSSASAQARQPAVIKHDVFLDCEVDQAATEVEIGMDRALRLVASAPDPSQSLPGRQAGAAIVANSAFIIMWMDQARPELVDVHQTIQAVCKLFGLAALRADDIQHEDRITEVVLQHIQRSEFLIADLTGERPNVYYEVGFAHAIGKRPILFRRHGTPLHFDLSVHNAPEYRNLTELRSLLSRRLEAILGRHPEGA